MMTFRSQEDAEAYANELTDAVMKACDDLKDEVDRLVDTWVSTDEPGITQSQVDTINRLVQEQGLSTTLVEAWIRETFGSMPQSYLGSLTITQASQLIMALERGEIKAPGEPEITTEQWEQIHDLVIGSTSYDQDKADAFSQANYGTYVWIEFTYKQADDFIERILRGEFAKVPVEPPKGWKPPEVGFGEEMFLEPQPTGNIPANQIGDMHIPQGAYEIVSPMEGVSQKRWADLYQYHAGSHFFGGAEKITKIRANADDWGNIGDVHFWDVDIRNEPHSMYTVGASNNKPGDLGPNEYWFNSDRATPDMGLTAFHKCRFGVESNETWAGYGVKMHLHQQAPHWLLVDQCEFTPAREHHIYSEWIQKLHVTGCVFPDTGGNAIQVGSRGGHVVEPNYLHGNRLNKPSGIDGWALIEDCIINEKHHGFRDASDITFAGFMGPIVIRNVTFNNTISAIAIVSDTFKGAWLASGIDQNWHLPMLWRKEVEGTNYPLGYYTTKEVWLDDLKVNKDSAGSRAMVMISGVHDVHIGSFDIVAKDVAAIEINNEYGGPFPCGKVTFHDQDSVERHLGRIGTHNKSTGRFRAYSEEELQDMMAKEPAVAL